MKKDDDDTDAKPPPTNTTKIDHSLYAPLNGNELYLKWRANRSVLPPDFDGRLLDPTLDGTRRGDLFEAEDEAAMENYAWAIPDARALRVLRHYGPLVEMGAGAGYWARLLRERYGDDVVTAYDRDDSRAAGVSVPRPFTRVEQGGPEVLEQHTDMTLLLIYPDDYEDDDDDGTGAVPLSTASLQHYHGDTVIHVGEWLGSTVTLSMEGQETPESVYPWGRSTSPDFQIVLEASFHRVLICPLPNWGSVRNKLTVWKRTTTVVLDGDRYGHVPMEERLDDMAVGCPGNRHLLVEGDGDEE